MADFKFLEDPVSKKWVILAPRRAKRPDIAREPSPLCPFCIGREKDEPELYRVGGKTGDSNWQIRVVPNRFPFAPIHEIIIHSPDHHKNFDELPEDQAELIFKTYRQRYNTHKNKGQVYIFHNRGEGGGESLPHPHTQFSVIPRQVKLDIPQLKPDSLSFQREETEKIETPYFLISSPIASQWPDEVWIYPRREGRTFGDISDEEISDLSLIVPRLIQILDLRHGHEFSFNFYIYPGIDWYLRIIPREKSLGGFEIGTGIFVNTQDPRETIAFIKEHLQTPNVEKIKKEHQAEYGRGV
ncbi:MAG: hypothetical protein A3H50_02940 [Candidatus Levybacteria bacterium RIFCSPLOWO2_02_FULL_37_10]|nr:MAG: hypothetical protein A2860_02490 [Candidatus Levybacteria bacterium RIFCSPHIGHO2_01_FULL_37_33]OGH15686.1 MAG: hypothetical protein A3C97_00825 [Candidatus Levybacteria bacterium RIFCSPHIGHO2_02_FULL_37_11]OGH30208.1 MAG: hypothetical protein A3F30_04460 [Candidatus Levybacteria bacterium RIFCSPHIGHO2_12_FULL_37_12]OGH33225.1 MAG: hypothetical protein A2953_00760 [Candidatus Levybacteria bacterium RIFCSPLOWO2_01_FULL_36_54]OGH43120.1 MAG: hypothetical protein A3H50_02940 [Candidatus Lev